MTIITDKMLDDIVTVRRFGIGVTRACSPFSLLTMAVTRSRWSHMFPAWEVEFDSGARYQIYYEMLFGADAMVGPRTLDRVVAWAARRPWRGFAIEWIPGVSEGACRAGLDFNRRLRTRCRGYGKAQLLEMLCAELFGWRIQHDPTILVCSEHACRVARETATWIDLRDGRRTADDAVTPGSGWARLQEILAGKQ